MIIFVSHKIKCIVKKNMLDENDIFK